ncbi:MAG: hypothetical protein A2Y23_09640 [Clostridiales bacterium GWB2_37_7]|nr:MAG: hypothetical protein A2Y23_09640 [Clostridiales bacterium GWB2_37_7]
MSFIFGDEIITEEIPAELMSILAKLKENTKVKAMDLMNTIANNDKLIAYIIPEAGMVVFANEIEDDNKIFRFIIGQNSALYIDNKQRRGDMFCPLFQILEEQIKEITCREAMTVADDKEYKIYDSFMPKIVDTINQIFTTKPEIFTH